MALPQSSWTNYWTNYVFRCVETYLNFFYEIWNLNGKCDIKNFEDLYYTITLKKRGLEIYPKPCNDLCKTYMRDPDYYQCPFYKDLGEWGSPVWLAANSADPEYFQGLGHIVQPHYNWGHLWLQCEDEDCGRANFKKFFPDILYICKHCGYHQKMPSWHRIELSVDPGTWEPMDEDMIAVDPIDCDSEYAITREEELEILSSDFRADFFVDSIKKSLKETFEEEELNPELLDLFDWESFRDALKRKDPKFQVTHDDVDAILRGEFLFPTEQFPMELIEILNEVMGVKEEPVKEEPVKEEPVKEEPVKEGPRWYPVEEPFLYVWPSKEKEDEMPGSKEKEDEMPGSKEKEDEFEESKEKEEPVKEEPVKEEPVKEEPVEEEPIWDPVEKTISFSFVWPYKEKEDGFEESKEKEDGFEESKEKEDGFEESKEKEDGFEESKEKEDGFEESKEKEDGFEESKEKEDGFEESKEKEDGFEESKEKEDGFEESDEDKPYKDYLDSYQKKTGLSEAAQTGIGTLNSIPVAIGVMDSRFIAGSMGTAVGEKIARLIEYATKEFLPLIIVCASGGARMQEGSLSLMQMAKISSVLYTSRIKKKLFYISILTSDTTGGVTASFGMLADIIIAEPEAKIAFAGKIVIEEALKLEVPEGVQEAEYLFTEGGAFDLIVPRTTLKSVLSELLEFHNYLPSPFLIKKVPFF